MKKFLFISSIMMMMFLVACGANSDDAANNQKTNDNTPANTEGAENETNEGEGQDVEENENNELTLQVLKQDEEEGITVENNEIYQVIQEAVDADPLMGDPNDLSLFPFDIIEYEDGTSSILFLVINRLDNPIQNLIFTLTFGNDEGEYIYEDHVVDLPEDYLGVLEKDGVVPILVDMEEEDEELFRSLTMDNVYLKLDDVGIDFVE